MEKKLFLLLLLFSNVFLNACAQLPQKEVSAYFYCKARYSYIDLKKKFHLNGTLLWNENPNEKEILIMGPLNILLGRIKEENKVLCLKLLTKTMCGNNIPKKFEPAHILLSPDFKAMLKGEKNQNDYLTEKKVQVKLIYENESQKHPSQIQFLKEKEWQLTFMIEKMEF